MASSSETNAVIKKYLSKNDRFLKSWAYPAITATGFGMDMLFTGGLGTLGFALCCYGLLGSMVTISTTHENKAQQRILCDDWVFTALQNMEETLAASFQRAAAPNASLEEKSAFLKLAKEVEHDAYTLSSEFRIVSGGPKGFSKDRPEFIMNERPLFPGIKLVSLSEAFQELTPKALPSPREITLEQEVKELKERLESLENPKPVILDKNPLKPKHEQRTDTP